VDIVGNGAIHKGMPHKYYHGRTGVIWNVTPRAVGVEVEKLVGNRKIKKRLHVRIEHVQKSRCREDFLKRVHDNEKLKAANKDKKAKKGEKSTLKSLKRKPGQPREGVLVKANKGVETISPVRYELLM